MHVRITRGSIGGLILACIALAASAATATAAPTFTNYAGPPQMVGDAGEPSIGYNPHTAKVFFQAGLTTARVDFSRLPPSWTDVTEPTAVASLDPILYTDRTTGRTFSSQLLAACSKMSFTDDDGATWIPSQGCGVGTGVDHQTVGGGPYSKSAPGGLTSYPNAVYYCAQASVAAECAISRDGGQTFGPGVPIYTAAQCGQGLHGHLKVDPSGTAYVPVFDCGGKQAVTASHDNGSSWTVEHVPGSTTQDESDPHLGIGSRGTLYFGYQGADGKDLGNKGYAGDAYSEGHPWIAVRPAGSTHWRAPIDVGGPLGIKNIQFPEVFAGDDGRAAYAFLGTKTAGDDQDANFKGVWHLYVSYTYDGGSSWTQVSPSTRPLYAAAFAAPARAVAVGLGGATVISDNAGDTFSGIGGVLPGSFTFLRAASPAVAYAFGGGGSLARTAARARGAADGRRLV